MMASFNTDHGLDEVLVRAGRIIMGDYIREVCAKEAAAKAVKEEEAREAAEEKEKARAEAGGVDSTVAVEKAVEGGDNAIQQAHFAERQG